MITDKCISLRITIPDHECVTLNQLYKQQHWSKRKNIADEVHTLVRAYAPRLAEPLDRPVDITVCAYRRRLIDADNVPAKLFVDGLCQAGVLVDDSKKYVDKVTTICAKGKPKVEITIWDAREATG